MVVPLTPPARAVPLDPNRIGGAFNTYPVDQSPFGKKNSIRQPLTNRALQFVPASAPLAPPILIL